MGLGLGLGVGVGVRTASKYSGMSRASSALDAGATSDGLITQQLPAARMATSGLSTRWIGKFHGAMSSTWLGLGG